jgi:hypothetical protein
VIVLPDPERDDAGPSGQGDRTGAWAAAAALIVAVVLASGALS